MVCTKCGLPKTTDQFYVKEYKATGPRLDSACKDCRISVQRAKRRKDKSIYARDNKRKRLSRAGGGNRARWLLEDSRKWDRRKGYGAEFDLDRDFIESLISKPCSYCEVTELIGLDRVDNTVGHVKTNVVPCCRPCNILRRDLPISVWKMIVPVILRAKKAGLLDEWWEKNEKRWPPAHQ